MKEKPWKKIDKYLVKPTKLPGVFEKKGGGFVVRARVTDPMTGRMREIKKVLEVEDARAAFNWLEEEKSQVRLAVGSGNGRKQPFGDYAVSLLEKKIALREIRSATGSDKWRHSLRHLIAGTESPDGEIFVPGFGEMTVDEIRLVHIDRWKAGHAKLIERGDYSPVTVNGWLSILRVVLKAACREFDLSRALVEDIKNLDTSDVITYSEEEPQSFSPEQVAEFLGHMLAHFPQHYAMTYLGLCTGLRPSSLRPLRRCGETPDVLWEEGRLLVRRSQTRGETVLQTTKQRTRYSVLLPEKVMKVLRWHVETQLSGAAQQESELLFPSIKGGFRSPCVLNKPFAEVSAIMGLGYTVTQIAMRRTFNDLTRAADVPDLVTRSISGHLTEKMQQHYSTVRGTEQVEALGKVIDLVERQKALAKSETENHASGALGGALPPEVVLERKNRL